MTKDEPSSGRAWLRQAVKWCLCAAVLWFVGAKAVELWKADDLTRLEFDAVWLVPAAVVYLLGWVPSIWFWRALLAEFGQRPGWLLTVKAYYLGHLGKYVPGKAMAIVLRSAALKPIGCPISVSAITATVETLALMGTGLAVWLALAPVAVPDEVWNEFPAWLHWLRSPAWIGPTLILVAVVVGFVPGTRLMSALAARLTPDEFPATTNTDEGTRDRGQQDSTRDETAAQRIRPQLLLAGFLAFIGAWFAHGLSLGLTLQSVGAGSWSFTDWPLWTCAVAGATSIGFFAIFTPGGLGVREGLLIATLQATTGGRSALAAAALLRVLWLLSELFATGALMLVCRTKQEPADNDQEKPEEESPLP